MRRCSLQRALTTRPTLGGFYERYEINDSNTNDLANYTPGSFFLAANDFSYKAKVGYVRLTYRW